jgi:hypothetical protein
METEQRSGNAPLFSLCETPRPAPQTHESVDDAQIRTAANHALCASCGFSEKNSKKYPENSAIQWHAQDLR